MNDCIIDKVDDKYIIDDFLGKNCLYDKFNNHIYFGIFLDNEIVSLVSCSDYNRSVVSINYFCNKLGIRIEGLLDNFLIFLNNFYKSLTTVNLYFDTRLDINPNVNIDPFEYSHLVKPSYYYTKNYVRRYLRKPFYNLLLETKPNIFKSNESEWDIMKNNKYDRLWNCGKLKYKLKERES